ncbi:MAG: MATE family efflux transporter [Eubacteriales bacterium]|nr:MATE family efflux transporter [Sarcina sp.]MBR2729227.1 MATE family efflux transporter [Lachnospiraceae bacterium]MDO4417696.1 MATE family efflux transporter [Eubacteriales bacterium]
MKQVDFENGSVFRNILQTSFPMLVAQVLSLLYSIVDRIYIGRIPETGTAALGGVGLCFPVIILVTGFSNLYGLGGAPLCSIERGRGDRDGAELVMNVAFFMMLGTAIVLTVAGELFCPLLLRLFGAGPGNYMYASAYMRIYLLGTVFAMIATGLNPYINAQGYARTGMLTVVIGAVTNIVLDPLFIFVLHLGVRGAALATILSQFLSAVFVLRFLTRLDTELKLRYLTLHDFVTKHLELAGDIVSLGMSSFVMQCTNSLVSICCNRVLSTTGGADSALYVSIMTIITSIRQLLDTPVLANGEGTSPVISYNYGAGRYRKVRRAILIMTIVGVGYTALMWVFVLIRPSLFISVFSSDTSILEKAVPALHMYFFAFVFQALQISGQTTFKALNKKRQAIFFSIFRKVIIVVPLTFLLPTVFGMGPMGVFMAEPVSNFVGGTACFVTMVCTVLPELRQMEKR